MLQSSPPSDSKTSEECQTFSDKTAWYLINKVRTMKSKIHADLIDASPDPMSSDKMHEEQQMSSLASVTVDEVRSLLGKMSGKSSPLGLVPTSLQNLEAKHSPGLSLV